MSPPFAEAARPTGRPGGPPERLLTARLRMARYAVRRERPLCERLDTDRLFRRFRDLRPGDAAFDPTTVTRNRRRLDDPARRSRPACAASLSAPPAR
jgi:hypothetical protein